MRSLFTKKSAKPNAIRQNETNNESNSQNNLSGPLAKILALPMPKIIDDSEYDQMDIFTAASLNSEIIQVYLLYLIYSKLFKFSHYF